MEANENHALTKAESCYHCKPLVQQHEPLVLALSENPPAALAALKAQWQAEAIDYAISEFSYCGCDGQAWVSELEQYAIKLRAQEAGDE